MMTQITLIIVRKVDGGFAPYFHCACGPEHVFADKP